MSWPALGWAAKQKPGRVTDKMVLIALADRHNEDCDLAWPSIGWLCEFCCLDRKTVIAVLGRLEAAGFIADSGERAGRTNQVKAYRLFFNRPEITASKTAPAPETVPKTEQSRKRNSSVFSRKESQKRNTEPSREPIPSTPTGVASQRSEKLDLSTLAAGVSPVAADWSPPPMSELSAKTRDLVGQWPAGAFEVSCEAFRLHWISNRRAAGRKHDWHAEVGKWLIGDHSRVMRAAKVGVSFVAAPTTEAAGGNAPAPKRPTAAKSRECAKSAQLHDQIRQQLGTAICESWFAPAALVFEGGDLLVIAPSRFHQQRVEDHHEAEIRRALTSLGWRVGALKFSAEPPARQNPQHQAP